MNPLRIKPAIFRVAVQCLNQLLHRVLRDNCYSLVQVAINRKHYDHRSDDITTVSKYQAFYCPTNAHSVKKNVELLKHFKISKTAPTCFGLQGNHHQGTTASN